MDAFTGAAMIPSRRSFLLGAGSLLAAPSIVRVASLMPISVVTQGITQSAAVRIIAMIASDPTIPWPEKQARTVAIIQRLQHDSNGQLI